MTVAIAIGQYFCPFMISTRVQRLGPPVVRHKARHHYQAKGIGNGFPIGVVLISPKFEAVYGELGTTFGGNHLACAAAEAVLEVMDEEKLLKNVSKVGNYLMDELRRIEGIKEVRGRGLMIGIEFEEPIKEIRRRLLFEEHVFTGVSGTNVIRLLPPLTLTLNEAEEFVRRFKKVLYK